MLSTVVLAVALVTVLAALGRSATPRAERLPLTSWGFGNLVAHVVLGVRRLNQLHERDWRTPPLQELHRSRRGD